MNTYYFVLAICTHLIFSAIHGMDTDTTQQDTFDCLQRSELHDAAFAGDHEKLSDILERYVADEDTVNKRDFQGRTPLHYAVKSGSCKCVSILLAHGANPNLPDQAKISKPKTSESNSPLDFAVKQGACDIVQIFLDSGKLKPATHLKALDKSLWARFRTVKSNRNPASNTLYNNIDTCCYKLLEDEKFFEKYSDLYDTYCQVYRGDISLNDEVRYAKRYPLHHAVRHNDITACKKYIQNDVEIDELDDENESPLSYAIKAYNYKMAHHLFKAGADLPQQEKNKLMWFVAENIPYKTMAPERLTTFVTSRKQIFELLLEYDADINSQANDSSGQTLLHRAIELRNSNAVIQLIGYGADTQIQDAYGCNALDIATLMNDPDIINVLKPRKINRHILVERNANNNSISGKIQSVSDNQKERLFDKENKKRSSSL